MLGLMEDQVTELTEKLLSDNTALEDLARRLAA
jgi:hypothetical protein